ncbi:coiled-coil domain-containing protein 50-like isoform X2 [Lytechinus variegatus]|uniref:coiled-coil domain-containing protein 50-like isoform X2 n=1 Tax=Lytechinus variegatus TaxID=7654 RepID=UPI001BB2A4AD|nr:coiled-coil domain-containing protein 50-like isoform X2 [Lytechinus variegatus]
MAESGESAIIEANNPGVKEVVKNWSVYEDGALAYQLQEEENVNHYTGNISRRRTVRGDREVAKDVAKETALEAFREEHEIAERNRKLEEEDRERARLLQIQMIKEEQEKALQAQESDEMLAKRMQMEEKRRIEAARKKRMEADQMARDAQLARRLSQQENGLHRPPHSGKHRTKTDYAEVEDSMGAMKLDDSHHTNHAHTHPHSRSQSRSHSHAHSRSSSSASAGGDQPLVVAMDTRDADSDEESDALAKITHDEQLARRIQREETQKSRPRTLSEEQQKQLLHDEKIARKMQHEEVMLAKKKTYNKYKQRVSDEIADPASSGKDAQPTNRPHNGNILASIDPTYNPGAHTNVVLTKKTPINTTHSPEPIPEHINGAPPPDFEAVQGTKRSTGKEKKKGSIFSRKSKKK